MIVFEYFYKKMDVFAPAVEKKQPKWKVRRLLYTAAAVIVGKCAQTADY